MKILWLLLLVHTALAQQGFGRSYLRDSRLCSQWSCLNTKLGFPDTLPTSHHFGVVLRILLPAEWHGVVDKVVNTCYHDRSRRYSNTCPGQAILHCAVDALIENCPEAYQRKEDACAPINSLAGFHYMFTQSRYENIEKNIAVERRPAWFVRNYFNTPCCNVPALVNSTLLTFCGFTNFIQYYTHNPTIPDPGILPSQRRFLASTPVSVPTSTPSNNGDSLQVVDLKDDQAETRRFLDSTTAPLPLTTPSNNGDSLHVVDLKDVQAETVSRDPLDCCDISEFIQPSWPRECNFELTWEGQRRLVVSNAAPTTAAPEPTSTAQPVYRRDVTVVPHTCEKETCVFSKLNIITNGSVDMDAFSRLLDNLTAGQPSWTKAKGRVVTTCLRKPLTDYTDECEINKVMACTFDVLTENCPNSTKNDLCKHSAADRTCQISSSKFRPKHRREICILPELVERAVLTECGLTSVSKTKPVNTLVKPKTHKLSSSINKCKDLSPSTTCLLSKMGVLNKFGFVDYFKMKDRIRNYTVNKTPTLAGVLNNAFNDDLLYQEHCNSPKKLLNLLDSMLMTCPSSRKQNTTQCNAIFDEINNSPVKANLSQEYNQRVLNHFLHVFYPSTQQQKPFHPRHFKKIKKTPIYHYGFLNDKHAPKVVTIDVKPKEKTTPKPLVQKPPLILLPVYMRVPHSNLMIRRPFLENGVMRGFPMNNPMNNAHITYPRPSSTTPIPTIPVSTTPIPTTPISTTRRILPQRVSTIRPFSTIFKFPKDEKLEMVKPE